MVLTLAAAQLRVGLGIEENVETICRRVRQRDEAGFDLIVFPECAVIGYDTGFIRGNRKAIQAGVREIARTVKEAGCYAVVGTPTFRGNRTFNSALVIDPAGRTVACYSKYHIWPGKEEGSFTPGNRMCLVDVKGVLATVIICADFFYPELTRIPALLGARIICHPSGFSSAPMGFAYCAAIGRQGFPHIRAVENEAFFVHADYAGSYRDGRRYAKGATKIVDPSGVSLVEATPDREDLITARIDTDAPPPVNPFLNRVRAQQPIASLWKRELRGVRRSVRGGLFRV